jgi:hypothetical protein
LAYGDFDIFEYFPSVSQATNQKLFTYLFVYRFAAAASFNSAVMFWSEPPAAEAQPSCLNGIFKADLHAPTSIVFKY